MQRLKQQRDEFNPIERGLWAAGNFVDPVLGLGDALDPFGGKLRTPSLRNWLPTP